MSTYATAAAAIARIDLDAHKSLRDEATAAIARFDVAIADAQAKIRAISSQVAEARRRGPNGGAAADALLASNDIMVADASIEKLERELVTLKAGLQSLHARKGAREQSRAGLPDTVKAQLADAVIPVVQEIVGQVRACLEDLQVLFADLRAIGDATANRQANIVAEQLGDEASALRRWSEQGLAPRGAISASQDVVELIEGARPAIELAHGRFTLQAMPR